MIDALMYLVFYLVVAGLLWWAVKTIVNAVPMPDPIKTVVNVILTVIICLIVLYALMGLIPHVKMPQFR